MAVFDKWVALKIIEFLFCVACLVAKRVSTDDEARLALLLQKLSREWSLLNSITWDSSGSAFADATYGGYVIITFGLIFARAFREIPRGRRILEGILLGFGLLFFLVLGGLELASLDAIPDTLTVNAAVLGALSLAVAALFLLDLMGPRVYTATRPSQTDKTEPVKSPKSEKKVSILSPPSTNGHLPSTNGHLTNDKQNGKVPERPKDLDLGKETKKTDTPVFESPKSVLSQLDDLDIDNLEKSKFGSLRNIEGGNYVRLSDPLVIPDRLHYEQELAKFNEKYFRDYLEYAESLEGKGKMVKEQYLPELQTPVLAKVKTGRLKDLYDEMSPVYEKKRQSKSPTRAKTVATPTLQQLEDYLKGSGRSRRADTPAIYPLERIEEKEGNDEGRASGTPTDPGYVQYTANRWPDKRELRTPRHSPTQ